MSTQETTLPVENTILAGPILPTSIKLAIPVLIGHLLNYTYAVVDTLFISMLDKDSTAIISGIGLIFPVFLLMIAIGTGIFAGTGSVLARIIGEKKHELIDGTVNTSLFLAIGTAAISLCTYLIWKDDFLLLLAGDELSQSAIVNGQQYLNYFLPGMLILLVFFSLAGLAQGAGMVQYFAMSMMLSTICNIILDPIFIFGFGLGVKGAAIASSISIGLATGFLFYKLHSAKSVFQMHLRLSFFQKNLMVEIMSIAIPQFLTLAVISIGVILLNFMVGSISEVAMNAWVLVGRMDEILLIFGYAISNATLTQVGQNYGSGDFDRVRSVYKTNVLVAFSVGLGIAMLYNLLAYPLFSLFSSVPSVIETSVLQVRITSFSFVGVLVLLVSNSMFQATGKAIPGLLMNSIRMIGVIVPFAYVAIFLFKVEIYVLFIIIVGSNLLSLFLSYGWSIYYLQKLKLNVIGR